jgi:hypothetical protein
VSSVRRLAAAVAASLALSCGAPPPPSSSRTLVVWQTLGSWAGRGLLQTDAFESSSGMLRVKWEARNESAPGAGTLKVGVYSAVSGRHLLDAVDHRGAGGDIAYVNEDPRGFFLLIESADLEWSVEVAEGIHARARDTAR